MPLTNPYYNILSENTLHLTYLLDFRTEQCKLFLKHKCNKHRPYTCFYWHFMNQRRRRPLKNEDGNFNYHPDIYCTLYDEATGICPNSDNCLLLHRTSGDTERRYHLRYYKTEICIYETDIKGICLKNGIHCAFSHGLHDTRHPLYSSDEMLLEEFINKIFTKDFLKQGLLSVLNNKMNASSENNIPRTIQNFTDLENLQYLINFNHTFPETSISFNKIIEIFDQFINFNFISQQNLVNEHDISSFPKQSINNLVKDATQFSLTTKQLQFIKRHLQFLLINNFSNKPNISNDNSLDFKLNKLCPVLLLEKDRKLQNEDFIWRNGSYVLIHYKTKFCSKPPRLCRQGYACPSYHNDKDRRRSPSLFKYRSTPCPSVKHGDEWGDPNSCEAGDGCIYCHTRTEQQFHPEVFKTTKCNDIIQTGYCPRGPFCAFAHIDQELSTERKIISQMMMNVPESNVTKVANTFILPKTVTNEPINFWNVPNFTTKPKNTFSSNNNIYGNPNVNSNIYNNGSQQVANKNYLFPITSTAITTNSNFVQPIPPPNAPWIAKSFQFSNSETVFYGHNPIDSYGNAKQLFIPKLTNQIFENDNGARQMLNHKSLSVANERFFQENFNAPLNQTGTDQVAKEGNFLNLLEQHISNINENYYHKNGGSGDGKSSHVLPSSQTRGCLDFLATSKCVVDNFNNNAQLPPVSITENNIKRNESNGDTFKWSFLEDKKLVTGPLESVVCQKITPPLTDANKFGFNNNNNSNNGLKFGNGSSELECLPICPDPNLIKAIGEWLKTNSNKGIQQLESNSVKFNNGDVKLVQTSSQPALQNQAAQQSNSFHTTGTLGNKDYSPELSSFLSLFPSVSDKDIVNAQNKLRCEFGENHVGPTKNCNNKNGQTTNYSTLNQNYMQCWSSVQNENKCSPKYTHNDNVFTTPKWTGAFNQTASSPFSKLCDIPDGILQNLSKILEALPKVEDDYSNNINDKGSQDPRIIGRGKMIHNHHQKSLSSSNGSNMSNVIGNHNVTEPAFVLNAKSSGEHAIGEKRELIAPSN